MIETREVNAQELRQKWGVVRLDALTTGHMSPDNGRFFEGVKRTLRHWVSGPFVGLCFTSGPKPEKGDAYTGCGTGKTEMSRWAYFNFADWRWADDGTLVCLPPGRFLKAAEFVALYREDGLAWVTNDMTCVVIDEIGREGHMEYVKSEDTQHVTRAAYMALFNLAYDRMVRQRPLRVIINSNHDPAGLRGILGTAVWSRFEAICRPDHRIDLTGLPDYRMSTQAHANQHQNNGTQQEGLL
jgi:hypothetical protein